MEEANQDLLDQLSSEGFFEQIKVHCDKNDEVNLFNTIKGLSPLLAKVPDHNVYTYPLSYSNKAKTEFGYIYKLFEYDRPDLIITHDKRPICVAEITEHAYTGDNGLQRFGRVASSAEQQVPFIYFGPASRVRDDELELVDDPSTLSQRSLTSDFYEGMVALHKRFGSYQLFCEWKTGPNGKVIKPPPNAGEDQLGKVFGELIELIASVVIEKTEPHHPDDAVQAAKSRIKTAQEQLYVLAKDTNTRDSDVKFRFSAPKTRRLIRDTSHILPSIGAEYFQKGKPDKLLALHAINNFSVDNVLVDDGNIVSDQAQVDDIVDQLAASVIFERGSIGYYSGYKWRSDPHCGVAINMRYRLCFQEDEPDLPLLLFYPRISIQEASHTKLLGPLQESLEAEFEKRYPDNHQEKLEKTTSSNNLYSTWNTGVKQDRIFRRYCTLILCNDGIVLGQEARELL